MNEGTGLARTNRFRIMLLLAGFLLAAMIGALVGGLAVYLAVWSADEKAAVMVPDQQAGSGAQVVPASIDAWDISTAITDTVDRIGPAVVTVINNQSPRQSFFGTIEGVSSGSGAIISADGYIITNNHVVEGAETLAVVLSDGSEMPAELVGVDTFADLAVLKVQGAMPAALSFGNSDLIKPGETVIAIGSPLGDFKNTVTVGVISAVDREINTSTYYQMEGLIQTDAAINSGNSGGPLVNLAGQIVGINTLVIRGSSGSASAEGLGFSIPSNIARAVVEQIITNGYVSRPALGISWGWITPAVAQRNGLAVEYGVYITEVQNGTPAEVAGLQSGDIITALDNQVLDADHPFVNVLFEYSPGEEVVVSILRSGEAMQLSVTLGDRAE